MLNIKLSKNYVVIQVSRIYYLQIIKKDEKLRFLLRLKIWNGCELKSKNGIKKYLISNKKGMNEIFEISRFVCM